MSDPTMTDKPYRGDMPKTPSHPEPHTMQWSRLELEAIDRYGSACYEAGLRALDATAQGMWQPLETAPRNPIKRVLLRWVSGQSEWICIGAWASAEDSPRLKIAGCPREGWMPDAGTCIPRNQKDCVGWMRLPAAAPIPAVDAVAGEPVGDEVGFTREQWVHHATRVYLACGDSEAEAAQCAEALADEQDWHGELDEPYEMALADIEGRGNSPRAVAGEPVASEHYEEVKATLQGLHTLMESLCSPEIYRRLGPAASHARGYTHKITAALCHLDALATPPRAGSETTASALADEWDRVAGEIECDNRDRPIALLLGVAKGLRQASRELRASTASASEREKRQAFHRHLQSRGIPSDLFQQDDAGTYEFATVEHDWQVWCAALATALASVQAMCACGDRPASECDEEWGPKCDLGNNAAHARVAPAQGVMGAEVGALPETVVDALKWLDWLSQPGLYPDRLGPLNEWLKAHPLATPAVPSQGAGTGEKR